MLLVTPSYTDWKIIVNNVLTTPKVASFAGTGIFTAWALSASTAVLVIGKFSTKPASFDADFPAAFALSAPLATEIG